MNCRLYEMTGRRLVFAVSSWIRESVPGSVVCPGGFGRAAETVAQWPRFRVAGSILSR